MIARTPRELEYYEARLKMERDVASQLEDALSEGIEKGREEGIEEGLEKGREQGEYVGRIRLLQQLLGLPESSSNELVVMSIGQLSDLANRLQTQLRERG